MKKKKKNKFIKRQFEKYNIIILLVPIICVLSLTYFASKSFLAKGQGSDDAYKEFQIYQDMPQDKIALACGDLKGEGGDRILTAAYENNSDLKIFNKDGELEDTYQNIFKDGGNKFNIIAGDIDGDGKDEIIKASAENKSYIEIFKNKELVAKFEAYKNINIGVSVASGDINNDGLDEIIVGAGQGGGPQVKVFNGKGQELASFFAFDPKLREGINVASGNFDDDIQDEIVASPKIGGNGLIKFYKVDKEIKLINTKIIYPLIIKSGVKILTNRTNEDLLVMKDGDKTNPDMKLYKSDGSNLDVDKNILNLDLKDVSDIKLCSLDNNESLVTAYTSNNQAFIKIISYN